MRIDEKTFPALFKNLMIESPIMSNKDKEMYVTMVDVARKNVYFATKTIMDAADRSFNKLRNFAKDIPDVVRTVLFIWNNAPHSCMYSISHHDQKMVIIGMIVGVYPNKIVGGFVGGYINKNDPITERGIDFNPFDYCTDEELSMTVLTTILCSELFLNFAEIETRICEPNWHIYEGPICAYNNKTKFPITVVDSSWYTNLIVSGAFSVSGHFRLQPHGPNREKRRLQWINEFQKQGYHRKAKKEMQ